MSARGHQWDALFNEEYAGHYRWERRPRRRDGLVVLTLGRTAIQMELARSTR